MYLYLTLIEISAFETQTSVIKMQISMIQIQTCPLKSQKEISAFQIPINTLYLKYRYVHLM